MWQRLCRYDEIKILKCGDYSWLLGELSKIRSRVRRVTIWGHGMTVAEVKESETDLKSKAAGLEDGKRVNESENSGNIWKMEKEEKWILTQSIQALQQIDTSSVIRFLYFWLPKLCDVMMSKSHRTSISRKIGN